jgi:hypothetical protein
MKTFSNYQTVLFLIITILIVSCIQDDEYSVPEIEFKPLDLSEEEVITIGALSNTYEQALNFEASNLGIDTGDESAMSTFRQSYQLKLVETPSYVEGFVVSNDKAGNFFEELILQDSTESPTNGIKVLLDVNPIFMTYQFGRKLYIKLDGLTVGYHSGVFSIGLSMGNSIEKIAESQQATYLFRDTLVATIVPKVISISEFSRSYTNLFVRLNDVQFNRYDVLEEEHKTFAAEPDDEFDGERVLEDCGTGLSTILSTSTFADFKASLLPDGRGTLDGILSMNYFGDAFNMVLNDPLGIEFNNIDRCDPAELNCGIAGTTGSNVLFSDYFETQNQNNPIDGNGWTNYVEDGSAIWEAFFDDSGNVSLGISARIGSYNTGDNRSLAWLITPGIDFNAQEGETLNFKTSNSFADGSRLELLFSNNWDGNLNSISMTSWSLLSAAYIVQNDDNFSFWFSSGYVDLSCITGTGYIAWKYTGSGNPAFDGTYELDEIEIRSN